MKDNRLFRILYYILENGKVTANELADKFEVSVRTKNFKTYRKVFLIF